MRSEVRIEVESNRIVSKLLPYSPPKLERLAVRDRTEGKSTYGVEGFTNSISYAPS